MHWILEGLGSDRGYDSCEGYTSFVGIESGGYLNLCLDDVCYSGCLTRLVNWRFCMLD